MHLCIDVIKISSTTVSRRINSDWHTYELFINYIYRKPYILLSIKKTYYTFKENIYICSNKIKIKIVICTKSIIFICTNTNYSYLSTNNNFKINKLIILNLKLDILFIILLRETWWNE